MRNHEKSLAVVRFAFSAGFCSFISRMKTPQKREHGLSNAYKAFQKNMEDIERLLELHTQEGGSEPGRRYGLEVLNKSAIVLITSFWEAFCEDLASDALDVYVKRAKTFDVLPLVLRKRIAAELKGDKHDLSPWQLAGDGWRKHLVSRLDELKRKRNWNFNSPNAGEVDALFKGAVGIPEITATWKKKKWFTPEKARKTLNAFVSLRGEIAHRGRGLKSITRTQVTNYMRLVIELARITEAKAWVDANSAVGAFTLTKDDFEAFFRDLPKPKAPEGKVIETSPEGTVKTVL